MNRGKKLVVFRDAANKKYGERTTEMAGRMLPLLLPRITTGSLSFDFALGGGFPVGHVGIFRGTEASGKTTAAIRLAGNAQQLCANCYRRPPGGVTVEDYTDEETGEVDRVAIAQCDCVRSGIYTPVRQDGETEPEFKSRVKRYQDNSFEEVRVAYIDIEGTFDNSWARRLGADPDRMLLVRASTAEEGIDLHDELVRTGAVDLVVVDSVAAMAPKDEVEKSAVEWQQGLQARLMNKMSRKTWSSRAAVSMDYARPVTEIWINQEREKIGIAYGDNTVVPGGKGQLFAASIHAKMWVSQWERETVDEELKKDWQMERATSVRMNFKIIKNKTATPMVQGSYRMATAGANVGDVLDIDYMVAQAEKFGLLRKDGTKWHLGDEPYKTKGEAVARIEEPAVRRALRATLVERMLAV